MRQATTFHFSLTNESGILVAFATPGLLGLAAFLDGDRSRDDYAEQLA